MWPPSRAGPQSCPLSSLPSWHCGRGEGSAHVLGPGRAGGTAVSVGQGEAGATTRWPLCPVSRRHPGLLLFTQLTFLLAAGHPCVPAAAPQSCPGSQVTPECDGTLGSFWLRGFVADEYRARWKVSGNRQGGHSACLQLAAPPGPNLPSPPWWPLCHVRGMLRGLQQLPFLLTQGLAVSEVPPHTP